MKQHFSRLLITPILLLIAGIIFMFTTGLQFLTGNPAAPLSLLAGVLMLINAIWNFSTPLLVFEENKFMYRVALLYQKTVIINNISKIEFPKKGLIVIYAPNQKVNIRLGQFANSQDKELVQARFQEMRASLEN